MDVAGFLERLQSSPGYSDQMVHQEVIPQKVATYGTMSRPLDSRLGDAMAAQGIHALYEHQAASIQAVRGGRHVVVSTGAASGKSLC